MRRLLQVCMAALVIVSAPMAASAQTAIADDDRAGLLLGRGFERFDFLAEGVGIGFRFCQLGRGRGELFSQRGDLIFEDSLLLTFLGERRFELLIVFVEGVGAGF